MGRTLFLPTSFKIVAALGAAFVLWGLLLAYGASPAQAATITVNSLADTTADDGQCTLREAITAANTDNASGECAAGSGWDRHPERMAAGLLTQVRGRLIDHSSE